MKRIFVALLGGLLVACSGGGGEALLRIDGRAIQALRSEVDLATGRLAITCADGRRFDVPVELDALEAPGAEVTVALPACGDARVDFEIFSAFGIPELRGASDTRLVAGFVDVEIPLGFVGQLSLKLADDAAVDSCVAVVERTSPDRVVVDSALTLSRTDVTTLIVPIGSYDVTCDGRIVQPLVAAGINVNASLPEPLPGPRLVSTTLLPTYPANTTRVDVTFTFSVPVTGFGANSVSIDNDGTIQAVNGSGSVYTVAFGSLNVASDYVITLSAGIVDADGLSLPGAPVELRFRVLANEYYVATTGNDTGNTGRTPSSPWRNLAYTLGNVSTPAIIHVAAGTYNEQVVIDNDITIEGGWSAGFVTRDIAANVTRIASTFRPVFFQSATNSVIDGFTIEGTLQDQVLTLQNADVVVRNCEIINSGNFTGVSYGILIEGTGLPTIVNNVVRVVGGNSNRAIYLQNAASARIIHNTIDPGTVANAYAIWVDSTAGDVSIVNNLFIGTGNGNTRVGVNGGAAPTALVSNAFASEYDAALYNAGGASQPIGSGDFGYIAPHRFSGNALLGGTTTLVDVALRPVSAALDIGVDSATADCGFTDTSAYPCFGPTTDRLGRARTTPTTAGAYQR